MEKKYTVFVSSTYRDLLEQRKAVANTILELEHIPVGMELFSAADEPSWEIIRQQLDISDYLVLLVAHRYGSELGGVGFVELEYDYATKHEIPVVAFFQNGAGWDLQFTDSREMKSKLDAFKEKVRASHQVVEWSAAADLGVRVMAGLVKQIRRTPRVGWIRANQAASPEVLEEVVRLSEENARLREASNDDSRFSLIDAMAEPVMCQAAIYMLETGKEIPKNARYIFGQTTHFSGAGQLIGFGRNTLESAGIFRSGAGGEVLAITEEGKKFAQWLIRKNRKAVYFWTSAGGWGKVNLAHINPSWIEGFNLGPNDIEGEFVKPAV